MCAKLSSKGSVFSHSNKTECAPIFFNAGKSWATKIGWYNLPFRSMCTIILLDMLAFEEEKFQPIKKLDEEILFEVEYRDWFEYCLPEQ